MAKRVLIADRLHITDRNFKSLITYLRRAGYEMHAIEHPEGLLTAFGHYEDREEIAPYLERMADWSEAQLRALSINGFNAFSIARAELMSRLAPLPHWTDTEHYGVDGDYLLARLYQTDRAALLENFAATWYWMDRWLEIMRSLPPMNIALVFSGSLIYARAFSCIMQRRQGQLYVCESFFTGQDYYLEARHSPLPNDSLLGAPGLYGSIEIATQGGKRRGDRAALMERLDRRSNKNVKQPEHDGEPLFQNSEKQVVILGQVVNDFSLLNHGETGFHSIAFYRNCIRALLRDTSANIVFKAHPWEQKKANVGRALTRELIEAEFPGQEERLRIVEDYSLEHLLGSADFVIGVNSQGLLEAALAGIKPIQVGKAFFGRKGFTLDDLTVSQIVETVNSLPGSYLSLPEYAALEDFFLKALNTWLVPEVEKEGIERLIRILGPLPKSAAVPVKPASKPATTSVPKKAPATELLVPDNPVASRESATTRKIRKFRQNPYAFFRDANSPLLRSVARLIAH